MMTCRDCGSTRVALVMVWKCLDCGSGSVRWASDDRGVKTMQSKELIEGHRELLHRWWQRFKGTWT